METILATLSSNVGFRYVVPKAGGIAQTLLCFFCSEILHDVGSGSHAGSIIVCSFLEGTAAYIRWINNTFVGLVEKNTHRDYVDDI